MMKFVEFYSVTIEIQYIVILVDTRTEVHFTWRTRGLMGLHCKNTNYLIWKPHQGPIGFSLEKSVTALSKYFIFNQSNPILIVLI